MEAAGRLTDRIGLGVLMRVVGPDLVDEVLVATGRTEKRRRLLPARVVVYFVLAMTLFFGLAECAIHAIIDAEIGAVATDERELTRGLLTSFEPAMLVIADRGFSVMSSGARRPRPAPICCGECYRV